MVTVTKPTPEEIKTAASKMRDGIKKLKENMFKHKGFGQIDKPEKENEVEK